MFNCPGIVHELIYTILLSDFYKKIFIWNIFTCLQRACARRAKVVNLVSSDCSQCTLSVPLACLEINHKTCKGTLVRAVGVHVEYI